MINEKIVGMESIVDLIWAPEDDIVDISPTGDTFLPSPPVGPGDGSGHTPHPFDPGPPSILVWPFCR